MSDSDSYDSDCSTDCSTACSSECDSECESISSKKEEVVPEKVAEVIPEKVAEVIPEKVAEVIPEKVAPKEVIPEKVTEASKLISFLNDNYEEPQKILVAMTENEVINYYATKLFEMRDNRAEFYKIHNEYKSYIPEDGGRLVYKLAELRERLAI